MQMEITKDVATEIVGEGNVARYWDERIPAAFMELQGAGHEQWNAIYDRLEDEGWKTRSVSLLRDLIDAAN
jgi:hypothetical protein